MVNNNSNNSVDILQILWTILISFFCAFSKKLNEYAKQPKKQHNFLRFISEILLSGVCGTLIGILTIYFFKNIYIVSFCSGVGGILGLELIKLGMKVLLVMKNIDLDKVDFDRLNEDYDYTRKKTRNQNNRGENNNSHKKENHNKENIDEEENK